MSENNYPKGLLSFTYNVNKNDEVKKLAINDLNQAMALFELDNEEKAVVKSFAEQGVNDANWANYCAALRGEVENIIPTCW